MSKIEIKSKNQTGGITGYNVTINGQENKIEVSKSASKENRFWEFLKKYWWGLMLPLGLVLVGLYGTQHEWFKIN